MEKFKIKIEDKNAAEYIAPKVFEFVEQILKNGIELGRGRAGVVFSREGESFCIKKIVDDNILFSSNGIDGEMDIQNRAIKSGVRSPKLIMTLQSADGHKFIVMEKINGGSLKDIKEGKIAKPEKFNTEYFWMELEKQIKKMHNSSVYHRDLHEGNVMFEIIKSENGEIEKINPVVIDYGLSTVVYSDEENPYLSVDFPRSGEVTKLPNDIENIKRMKREMSEYLT